MPHWRIRRIAATLLALALLLILALGWYAGSLLAKPAHRPVGAIPAGLAGEAVRFESASGSLLHGWLFPGEPGGGVVVLMHGVRGDRRDMLPRARFLLHAGYGVLVFDFQAHGESTGRHITFGHRESMDAQAAVALVRARFPQERVRVIGVSLGGAATVLATPPLDVDALVLEMVYSGIERATENRLRLRLGEPGLWLAPLLRWQLRPRLGISSTALQPLTRVGALEAPVLIVGGSDDQHTTLAETHALYAAANAPKELWIVEAAEHVNLHAFAPAAYEERISQFLEQWLRNGPQ